MRMRMALIHAGVAFDAYEISLWVKRQLDRYKYPERFKPNERDTQRE